MEREHNKKWEEEYHSHNTFKKYEKYSLKERDIPKNSSSLDDKKEVEEDTSMSLKEDIAIYLLAFVSVGLIGWLFYKLFDWLIELIDNYFGPSIASIFSLVIAGCCIIIGIVSLYSIIKDKKKDKEFLRRQELLKKEKENIRENMPNYTKEFEHELEKVEYNERSWILGFNKKDDGYWYIEDSAVHYINVDKRMGADAGKLCEHLSTDGKIAAVGIVINPSPYHNVERWCRLEKIDSSIAGDYAIYRVVNVNGFTGTICLGPTTTLVLGEYPETIYFVNAYYKE